MYMDSLWGEDFSLPEEKPKVKKIVNKVSNPKETSIPVEKLVKKSQLVLKDKLKLISDEVIRVLGKQKNNILCIKDKDTFHSYITKAINNGRIDIDTETNNSLDPITCNLMGLCLYTPGEKQVYIPINHRDPETKQRLEWQLTEKDCKEELERILQYKGGWIPDYPGQSYNDWYAESVELPPNNNHLTVVMHNGKFDYQVLKCTCDVKIPPDWDTMIACKLIDENEFSAGLKQQYIAKIDPEQEKYSIDHLFEGVEYADVDPDIFSYYAATDAFMTDKLYEYQIPIMQSKEFEKIYNLFKNIEMPLVEVLAEMELKGIYIDQEYGKRLSDKYHKKLTDLDENINQILIELTPRIDEWRSSSEANSAQKKKQTDKQYERAKSSPNFDETLWSKVNGEWYKVSKSKLSQLGQNNLTPEDLASPVKLGILLYDILGCPVVNKEKPYATGEDELKLIFEKTKLPLCDLMLKRRELVKLLSTYIDNIPELALRWPDGRVRTHFHQYGAQTGRLSSSEPLNLQNIPSHEKSIRLLFRAETKNEPIDLVDNYFDVPISNEVETSNGWKYAKELSIGERIISSNGDSDIITDIKLFDTFVRLYI